MTKQEAIKELNGIHKFIDGIRERGYGSTHSNRDAIRLAIQALTDPEWIPNTGTKPECRYAWVRWSDGFISARLTTDLIWMVEDSSITHYIPIPAPPEFVEKRRYVVETSIDKTKVGAYDNKCGRWVGYGYLFDNNAKGNEAAQAIADIYERMNEEQP